MASQYSADLDKNAANFTPLSPLTFIERAASVYPERTAVIYGELRRNWADTYARCRRFASALRRRGVGDDDTVSRVTVNARCTSASATDGGSDSSCCRYAAASAATTTANVIVVTNV